MFAEKYCRLSSMLSLGKITIKRLQSLNIQSITLDTKCIFLFYVI